MPIYQPTRRVTARDIEDAIHRRLRGPAFEVIRQVVEATRVTDPNRMAAVVNAWVNEQGADPRDVGDPWTWQRFKPWAIERLGGVHQTS